MILEHREAFSSRLSHGQATSPPIHRMQHFQQPEIFRCVLLHLRINPLREVIGRFVYGQRTNCPVYHYMRNNPFPPFWNGVRSEEVPGYSLCLLCFLCRFVESQAHSFRDASGPPITLHDLCYKLWCAPLA